ncbi:MAG TPA: hypothetical protein VHV83_02465, partial [Armatimonadota bacterium]|nr:hypothetical protein [Armatimonadota bacterium]
ALDAVDVHLYGFNGTAPVPGAGNSEGPENLLTELAHCREIMAKHGDANRPIIATETGCSTCGPRITADVQAQWIVRTHLLLAAAGVRRIYWYAFQDEGTNPTNGEHHFGIVDWYGHPKPAYTTYRVMTELLSNAHCDGFEAGVHAPVYAVRCSTADGYITAVWDCGGSSELRISSNAGITRMLSLTGDVQPLPTPQNNELTITVDERVCYLISKRPLQISEQHRITPAVAPQITMTLSPTTVYVSPETPSSWSAHVTNAYACPVNITVYPEWQPWGKAVEKRTMLLQPGESTDVTFTVTPPAQLSPKQLFWYGYVRCQYTPTDTRWPEGSFKRTLAYRAAHD